MPSNYTPIDVKKWETNNKSIYPSIGLSPKGSDKDSKDSKAANSQDTGTKNSHLLNIILGGIIIVTLIILGVLLFQLYQRNLLNTLL